MECTAGLIIIEKDEYKIVPLEGKNEWGLGRKTSVSSPEIPLTSVIASKDHGKFLRVDTQWFYCDHNSLNGTYYNGKKIAPALYNQYRPILLQDKDVLQICNDKLDNRDSREVYILFVSHLEIFMSQKWKLMDLIPNIPVIIGRNSSICNLVFPSIHISAVHAKIEEAEGHYYLVDNNSTNGTWIHKRRIKGRELLKDGEGFEIYDHKFFYLSHYLMYEDRAVATSNPVTKLFSGQTCADINKNIILHADIEYKDVPNRNGKGKIRLLESIHLDLLEGTLVALLGGSGAGKSTLMNCISGMDTSGVSGTVIFKGENLIQNFERFKCMIGSVPQQNVVHMDLRVEDELWDAAKLRLPGDTSKAEIKQRVNQTLEFLGLNHVRKLPIKVISGGELKRVNIGIELVSDRTLLCIDEPDAGLDPKIKVDLIHTLQILAHDQKKTIIVIVHDSSLVEMFDQVLFMKNGGRLAYSGTPQYLCSYFGVKSVKEVYEKLAMEDR